jgi:hypothetical protein
MSTDDSCMEMTAQQESSGDVRHFTDRIFASVVSVMGASQ